MVGSQASRGQFDDVVGVNNLHVGYFPKNRDYEKFDKLSII